MLILHIITGLGRGGAELMLHRLISQQRADPTYRHRVISLRAMGDVGLQMRETGIEVESLAMRPWSLLPTLWRLYRRIRETNPDIVQTWMYLADLIGGIAARMAGVKRIIWGVRIADISPELGVSRLTLAIRWLCARFSHRVPSKILYVAQSARRVHEGLGYALDRSIVIHNGYDIPSLEEVRSARVRRRAELALPANSVLIGSAGRFSPQKGYRGFIEAAGQLASQNQAVRFLIVGRDVSWENAELAGWIRTTGHADRFHLLGERREIGEWLAALDVFVLFSLGEGFPNIVAEAMSTSVPCIVTDVGDAALLVDDTGLVIKARDCQGLADSMLALIARGADERDRLGRAARERVERHFSMKTIASRYQELYDRLAASDASDARLSGVN